MLPDPRVTNADYRAARAFSESLYDPMEKAWRGYAETEAVRKALNSRIAQIHDPALLVQAKALAAKLEPPKAPNAGFEGTSGTLASLETSAEGSDAAPRPASARSPRRRPPRSTPTGPRGSSPRTSDLDPLNRRLKAAGLQPILVPAEAELSIASPVGGVDLP